MRDSGRLAAAIEVLSDFERRRVPLKTALADWARGARYAGAKDRAWISGLCLDVLRRRNSLALVMDSSEPRAHALYVLKWLWKRPLEDIAEMAAEAPHGPGALSDAERRLLMQDGQVVLIFDEHGPLGQKTLPHVPDRYRNVPNYVQGDYPEWTEPLMRRAFGSGAVIEGFVLASRADVDLRINTLKTTREKALDALKVVGAEAHPLWKTVARIAAPPPSEKTADVTIIPAFNKGWVEVQDLGSQIAAGAAGAIQGAQVLDYCAGGGGKTLALAALMENKGQIYAYDDDARRLKPLYERAQRAGARNLQIINPLTDGEALARLKSAMDVVFVDAPCTGSGVWRRHPDSKWRLTPEQLQKRMAEQDAVLREASAFVKPGGRLVYVTCSVFMEENEDRIDGFLKDHPQFRMVDALDQIAASGLVNDDRSLAACRTEGGALRLTPARIRTDGFFIAVLALAKS